MTDMKSIENFKILRFTPTWKNVKPGILLFRDQMTLSKILGYFGYRIEKKILYAWTGPTGSWATTSRAYFFTNLFGFENLKMLKTLFLFFLDKYFEPKNKKMIEIYFVRGFLESSTWVDFFTLVHPGPYVVPEYFFINNFPKILIFLFPGKILFIHQAFDRFFKSIRLQSFR